MGSRRVTQRLRQRQTAATQENFLETLLSPIDLLSEAVYSVLIVLTFTLAYRIWLLGDAYVPGAIAGVDIFWAALGAAVAWGLIDGIMYALMGVLERGERHRLLVRVQMAEDENTAVDIIAEELNHILEPITNDEQRHHLYQDILAHLQEGEAQEVRLQKEDLTGALGSVLVAILVVIPSLIPLYFINDYNWAIRVSNIVSFVVLFGAGYGWGQKTGANPWKTGLALAAFGLLMVLIAIPLGG